MKLEDFLELMELTVKQFAEIAGVDKQTIYRYVNQGEDIRLSTAIKIEKASLRKVTCQDLAQGIKTIKGKSHETETNQDQNN